MAKTSSQRIRANIETMAIKMAFGVMKLNICDNSEKVFWLSRMSKSKSSFNAVPSNDPLLNKSTEKSDASDANNNRSNGGWFGWFGKKKVKSEDDDGQYDPSDAEPLLTEEEAKRKKVLNE